ncbi:MAG: hypothetical protein JW730_12315 [Anaerolineales bacterium]|nr:hypothetical protein [Anaerolineales bacterium]
MLLLLERQITVKTFMEEKMDNQQASRNKLIRYLVGGGASLMLIGFFLLPWATGSVPANLGGNRGATGCQMLLGDLFPDPILGQFKFGESTPGLWLLIVPVVSVLVLSGLFILDRLHKWRKAYWLAVTVAALVSAYPLLRLLSTDTVWVSLRDMAFSY